MKLERYALPAALAVSAGAAFLTGAFYREHANQECSPIVLTTPSGQTEKICSSWNAVVLYDDAQTFDILGGLAVSAAAMIAIRRRLR
jgi:hypothetical protein